MEIILVHWLIRNDKREEFVNHWKYKMKVGKPKGFYREILTRPVSKPDPKYNTFSVTDKHYETFINIGIWDSVEDFEEAIKSFFPPASEQTEQGRTKQIIELEDFEYKLRERIVLKHIDDRGIALPDPSFNDG